MATYDLEHDKLEAVLELNETRWRRSLNVQAEQSHVKRLRQEEANYKKWRDRADNAINNAIALGLTEAKITCETKETTMNKRVLRELKKRFRVYRRILCRLGQYEYVIKLKR